MSKKLIFKGVATALVTPFKNGEIDYEALFKIIEMQIESGIEAFVIGGTTGECSTLDDEERTELYYRAKAAIAGRARVILGVGTNDTRITIERAKAAQRMGADGLLAVTPYYNKGTKSGLISHYERIAASTDIPIILYNVPSRTGVNLSLDILDELTKYETIVGIKEASNDTDRLLALSAYEDELWLYSGNDTQIYTTLCLGGAGVISVASNPYPAEILNICKLFFTRNLKESLNLQRRMLPVLNSMFAETNPAPVKHMMKKLGLCSSEVRLPLGEVGGETKELIDRAMRNFKG